MAFMGANIRHHCSHNLLIIHYFCCFIHLNGNITLLKQQGQDGELVKVTEVALAPPPINEHANGLEGTELTNMMGAMGPMYASLIRSMLDAQLTFYKQPGKLTEVAKVHKQYFDALIKEGFTYDQAIKILTSSPLIQMTGASGK
jgi:hypothetical protein